MPAKNIVKEYEEHCIFHIYNRGVDRRKIFLNESDFKYFESLLEKLCKIHQEYIEIFAFCLMDNHFHLLISQTKEQGITKFMHALMCRYGIYFNKKYGRSGRLCENIFRGSKVENDSYLITLFKYIHENPKENFIFWKHSSLLDYLHSKRSWISTSFIKGQFVNYEEFLRYNFLESF